MLLFSSILEFLHLIRVYFYIKDLQLRFVFVLFGLFDQVFRKGEVVTLDGYSESIVSVEI